MIVYLAGGVTGNLIKEWQNYMKLFLAGGPTEKKIHIMKLFLAAPLINNSLTFANPNYDKTLNIKDLFILESYHYIGKQEWMFPLLKELKVFIR
jgi:hypothetical protein